MEDIENGNGGATVPNKGNDSGSAREQAAPAGMSSGPSQERITYTTPDGVEVEVPIYRAGMPEVFVALQPPQAQPYIMAAREADVQDIVKFFAERVAAVEELRRDMQKRFAKGSYGKCRYQTGDVAYVMGRPFQLRVYPLGEKRMKNAARGRATSKFNIAADVSLITIYVVHPRNYDEAKLAFNGYAENVILRNATGMVQDFSSLITPGSKPPTVRMRAMRGRWTSNEAGALWLSTDIIPYPPDCLVYVIWKELEKLATIPSDQVQAHFERILPGWQAAQKMLADRPEPYNLQ